MESSGSSESSFTDLTDEVIKDLEYQLLEQKDLNDYLKNQNEILLNKLNITTIINLGLLILNTITIISIMNLTS
jgi:hypothetical protein